MPAFFEFYGKGHGELIPSLPWERKRRIVNVTERKPEMTHDSLLHIVGTPVIVPERTEYFRGVGTFFTNKSGIKMWDPPLGFIDIDTMRRTLGPAPERTYIAFRNCEQVTMNKLVRNLPIRYQSNLADAAYLIGLQENGAPGIMDTSDTDIINTFFLEGKNQQEVVLSAYWYTKYQHWSIQLQWREDIEAIRANMTNIIVPQE